MPEGDTVFAAARRLHEALAGKTLTHGELRHPRLSTIDLSGWTTTEVVPVGKHLFVRFGNGESLHSHLRMDGSWHLYAPGTRWRVAAHHVRAVLRCDDQEAVGIRLHDLAVLPSTREDRLVGHLGPDLLADEWPSTRASEAARRLSLRADEAVGLVLLDQTVVAGIGNVYQAEICFRLGVAPVTTVGRLDESQHADAVRIARELLWDNRSRTSRSTTGDHRPGNRYWVYQRRGQPCRRCATPIRTAVLGTGPHARKTWFCPNCQPVYR